MLRPDRTTNLSYANDKALPSNNLIRLLSLISALTLLPFAYAIPWLSNYNTALSKAREDDKLVILFFTGSDWCHWCQKLERELFSEVLLQNELPSIAVPLHVDFPRRKTISQKQRRINQALKETFKVDTFPTVIILDPVSGEQLLRHTYTSEKPDHYLRILKDLKTQLSEKS